MRNRKVSSDRNKKKGPNECAARWSVVARHLGLGAHAEVTGVPREDFVTIVRQTWLTLVVVVALVLAFVAVDRWDRDRHPMDGHRDSKRTYAQSG